MALINKLEAIGDAIRAKTGESSELTLTEMATAISNLSTGAASPTIESLSISTNGTYTAPSGVDGYSPISVSVQPTVESLSVDANGTYTPGTGVDGFSSVVVDVQPVIESLNVTANGTYNVPTGKDGYGPVVVAVPPTTPNIQSLNVTENGTYTPSSGVDGYGPVVVDVPSSGGNLVPLTMSNIQTYTPSGGVDGYSSVTPAFDLVYTRESSSLLTNVGYIIAAIPVSNIHSITYNLTSTSALSNLFYYYSGRPYYSVPTITVNCNNLNASLNIGFMFYGANDPNCKLDNATNIIFTGYDLIIPSGSASYFLSDNYYLEYLPTNIKNFITKIFSNLIDLNKYSPEMPSFANRCVSWKDDDVRSHILSVILDRFGKGKYSSGSFMQNTFQGNTLWHTIEIEPIYGPMSKNILFDNAGYTMAVQYCCVRHFKFKPVDTTREDYSYQGWTITLPLYFGWITSTYLPKDTSKRVTDATTYELYKDDPDGWTTLQDYSFYNHDSAVETINSLPDMTLNKYTGSVTNTLNFHAIASAGSSTPEGAINTLTAEEIAVGTAKGWTITL